MSNDGHTPHWHRFAAFDYTVHWPHHRADLNRPCTSRAEGKCATGSSVDAACFADDPSLPHQLRLTLPLAGLAEDGLPTGTDFEAFEQLNAAVARRLKRGPLAVLVRYAVYADCAELIYRCPDPDAARTALKPVLKKWPQVALDTLHDPDWAAFWSNVRASGPEHEVYMRHAVAEHRELLNRLALQPHRPEGGDHPALKSNAAFRRWVKAHPPRCLAGLDAAWVARGVKPLNDVAAAFDLAHPTLGDACRVHAHLNAQAAPVHLAFGDGDAPPFLLLDTAVHGWGDTGRPAVGAEGVGPAVACAACGGVRFRAPRVRFDYAAMSDLEDEPADFPVQDWFGNFDLAATCAACGRRVDVVLVGETKWAS